MSDTSFRRNLTRRAILAGGVAGCAGAGLGLRLAQLQLLHGEDYETLARENRVRLEPTPGPRGFIYDRTGEILAGSRRNFYVTLIPENSPDPATDVQVLAELLGLSETQIARLNKEIASSPGFVPLTVADDLSWEEFARVSVHTPKLPGMETRVGWLRAYPKGELMAHIVGYVSRPNQAEIKKTLATAGRRGRAIRRLMRHPAMRVGKSGIEAVADQWLTGTPGYRLLAVNADGRVIENLKSDNSAPRQGNAIVVSLDAAIQKFAVQRFGSESGSAVVLDIASGDVLAMTSTPAFDPNDFVSGISLADYDILRQNERSPLYHKAYDGVYPPGSTFKPIVAAAALEASLVDPEETVECTGKYRLGRGLFHCWKEKGHGPVNLHQALVRSCDVYFYDLARKTGLERISAMAERFGFGTLFDLGSGGGVTGLVPTRQWKRQNKNEAWMLGETLNLGIGQGYVNATPLQMAVMTARLAVPNAPQPRLILRGPDISAPPARVEPLHQDTAAFLRQALYGVTSEPGGTARASGRLGTSGLRMAGKTGTVQVRRISEIEREQGVRSNQDLPRHLRDHALFIGYAPHDAPRYACAVVVEHAGSGSRAAAPVARDILAMTLRRDPAGTPVFAPKTAAELS